MPHRGPTARGIDGAAAALVAFVLAVFAASPVPDDWDGIGFVRALAHFDLATFRPHAPGYPGYVATAWLGAQLTGDATRGCTLASALGGALLVFAGARIARVHGALVLASLAAAPIVAWCATAVGADALALGWLACALACVRVERAGVLLGLALATRPSLLPTALIAWSVRAYVVRDMGWRAWLVASGVVVAAFVPVVVHEGAASFWRACVTQAHGHFATWGDTAFTASDPVARVMRFGHRVRVQGLGFTSSIAGIVRAVVVSTCVAVGVRSSGRRTGGALVVAVAAEALVVLLAQNVDGARHALALAVVTCVVAARGASVIGGRVRGVAVGALGLAFVCSPTASWLHARIVAPPAGLVLARTVAALDDAVLFGGRAARFGELAGVTVVPCTWMGEVDVVLARQARWPRTIALTGEVRFRERATAPVRWIATACRDGALPAGGGCESLWRYDVRDNLPAR